MGVRSFLHLLECLGKSNGVCEGLRGWSDKPHRKTHKDIYNVIFRTESESFAVKKALDLILPKVRRQTLVAHLGCGVHPVRWGPVEK